MKKTILITGATTGIGRDAALTLAKKGHRVIATGRNERALAALVDAAKAAGTSLDTVALDVTSQDSVDAALREVDKLTDGYGVDVLVNNAGYGVGAPVIEVSHETLVAQYDTNVFGLMRVTRAFVAKMCARKQGRIINVSSIGGRMTLPFMAVYNSTKYAVESLSDGLRMELSPFNIQVSLVEPGPINTEFANRTMSHVAEHASTSSPYAAIYARSEEMRRQSDAQSVGPEVVTAAIEHAATATRARARYVVPFKGRVMLWLASMLPTRTLDWVMRKMIGLSREQLLTA
jgi:short-subunit dehydrogenase